MLCSETSVDHYLRGTNALLETSQPEELHTTNVKESLTLEYKASPAIDKKEDAKKIEMARDVSASQMLMVVKSSMG